MLQKQPISGRTNTPASRTTNWWPSTSVARRRASGSRRRSGVASTTCSTRSPGSWSWSRRRWRSSGSTIGAERITSTGSRRPRRRTRWRGSTSTTPWRTWGSPFLRFLYKIWVMLVWSFAHVRDSQTKMPNLRANVLYKMLSLPSWGPTVMRSMKRARES